MSQITRVAAAVLGAGALASAVAACGSGTSSSSGSKTPQAGAASETSASPSQVPSPFPTTPTSTPTAPTDACPVVEVRESAQNLKSFSYQLVSPPGCTVTARPEYVATIFRPSYDGVITQITNPADPATQPNNVCVFYHPGNILINPGQTIQEVLGDQWPKGGLAAEGGEDMYFGPAKLDPSGKSYECKLRVDYKTPSNP